MQLLASFGMGFDVEEINIDQLTLSDWISLFNTALIQQQAIIDSLSLYQDSNLALWDSINSLQEDLANLNLSGTEPSVLLLSAEDILDMDTPFPVLPVSHDIVIIENFIQGYNWTNLQFQLYAGEEQDPVKKLKVCTTANPQWNNTPPVYISVYEPPGGSPFSSESYSPQLNFSIGNNCIDLIRLSGWWFTEQ